jgi:hypothetical protein
VRYLGQFFAQNNRRVERNALPALSQVAALST